MKAMEYVAERFRSVYLFPQSTLISHPPSHFYPLPKGISEDDYLSGNGILEKYSDYPVHVRAADVSQRHISLLGETIGKELTRHFSLSFDIGPGLESFSIFSMR
jgi:hypothetical protein